MDYIQSNILMDSNRLMYIALPDCISGLRDLEFAGW